MKSTLRLVLALHQDPAFTEKLRAACAGEYIYRLLPDWDELLREVGAAPATAVLVVDPRSQTGSKRAIAPELAALLGQFPSATVVAALDAGPGCFDQIRQLGELGVARMICLDEAETHLAIREHLRMARGRPLRNLLTQSLPPRMNGMARSILNVAMTVVLDAGQGADFARALYVTPRTLLRWCRRSGLPPPKQLLAWLRMLLAAELLDDPGRRILDVALACGYAADSSMRNAMRAFLGCSPSALRNSGAFQSASSAFLGALHQARSENRRYRAPRVNSHD